MHWCLDPRVPPIPDEIEKVFPEGGLAGALRIAGETLPPLSAQKPDRCAAPGLPHFSAQRAVLPRAVSFSRLYLEKAALALVERRARSAQEQSPFPHGTICIAQIVREK